MMENGKQIQMNTDNQQCKEPTKPKKKGDWLSVTSFVSIYGCLGCTVAYMIRNSLSMAIVAMKNEFEWNEKTQGTILGSFYYGYVATNLLGGRIADYFGAKLVLGLSLVLTALFNLLTPVAARFSTLLLLAVRIMMGMTQGVFFPAISTLLSSWTTLENRGKVSLRINSGISLGIVLVMPISAALAQSELMGGWPSIFYVVGGLGLASGFLLLWVIEDDPRQHSTISNEERDKILKSHSKYRNTEVRKVSVPWTQILTSFPFWVIVIVHTGNEFGFYLLAAELPTYLDEMLHFDMSENGILSALPYVGSWMFALVYGSFISYCTNTGKMTVLNVRKLSMVIGLYGPMIGMLILAFAGNNSTLIVTTLIVTNTINSATFGGFNCSLADISPQFAGTLMGISNTISSMSGFAAPTIAGILTNNNQTLKAWRTVFLIVAAIYFVSVTQYIVFATDKVQPWDDPTQEAKKENEANDVEHAKIPSIVVDSVDTRL